MGKGKRGRKGKKSAEKKLPPVKDGLLPIDMSRKQMLGHVIRLKEEIEREKEERNFFMMEREKLYQRWQWYIEQIAIEKAKVKSLKSHLDDRKKDQFEEEKLQNSKLRFLKAESTRKLGQLRILHLQQMAAVKDEAWIIHMLIKEEVMAKKKEIRKAQRSFYQFIRGLHWKHFKQVSDLREEFANEIRRLETSAVNSLFNRNEEAEDKQIEGNKKLANEKKTDIKYLIEDHEWQFHHMQEFFQSLLKTNLDLINVLKEEVKTQMEQETRQKHFYNHFKKQYDTYVKPALYWHMRINEWTIMHEEDSIRELIYIYKQKEAELEDAKYRNRMLEVAIESIIQKRALSENELSCKKKILKKATINSQMTASMNRFVRQLKLKAARKEADLYEGLNKTLETEGETDGVDLLFNKQDGEAFEHLEDINYNAWVHDKINCKYAECFQQKEINLAELGYPLVPTEVRKVNLRDLGLEIDEKLKARGLKRAIATPKLISEDDETCEGLEMEKSISTLAWLEEDISAFDVVVVPDLELDENLGEQETEVKPAKGVEDLKLEVTDDPFLENDNEEDEGDEEDTEYSYEDVEEEESEEQDYNDYEEQEEQE